MLQKFVEQGEHKPLKMQLKYWFICLDYDKLELERAVRWQKRTGKSQSPTFQVPHPNFRLIDDVDSL